MADLAMGRNVEDRPKTTAKRKRPCLVLSSEEKESQIKGLNEEMVGLFGFYQEMITSQRLSLDLSACSGSLNGLMAALMEESSLPLSRLVEEIHVKLREKEEMSLTPAAVKSAVLYVGQRVMYGVPNVDADVLEDDTETSLWCWETRDAKLLPKSVRGALKIRRICRKKIHERITAVSAKLNALQKSESDPNFSHDLTKASERLSKVFGEAEIRVLVDSMLKKNDAELVEKDAKREEKLIIKQLEKTKREVEKEKKKMDRELQKEKQQSEKELKRLREEAEKDERRREKEECEMRKQLRKQQEEAEKDQRRREKEEAEFKKQLAIKKQASIMERFLKRSKTSSPCQNDLSTSGTATTSDSLSEKCGKVAEAVTMSMDCALSSNDQININDLRRYHLSSWRHFGLSVRSNQNQHWGMRRKPKTALFKELKLTTNRCLPQDDDLTMEKLVDRWGEQVVDDRSCITSADNSSDVKKCNRRQLLQFDKSYRPAFYGIWPKKSHVVGPRHPLRKDPDLDYDVDSDEEWEEEDPGESLSDCDKDDEEEGCSKGDDEEETEDGFFVPDGYLSEDEGVQVDRMEVDLSAEETKSSPSCKQELQSEESCALLQQQKYLHNVTEHALRKNQPMIILNLMHEKTPLLLAEDLSGTSKMEQTCLQALTMRAFPAGLLIEITVDGLEDEEQEACLSNSKGSTTPVSTVKSIPESDLPTIVSVIQSCSTGINKVVESLQQKFPATPKSQLRNKVREISDFTDNRWQVKKEILAKLGMSISPEKNGGRAKSIAKFFSKRCLPPDGRSVNPNETSPLSSRKPGPAVHEQQVCTYNHL